MCGIWGLITYGSTAANTDLYHLASETVKPRGPERTTIKQASNYFLSFHRLAINGLSTSCDQPYQYEVGNDTFIVLCNGEIYNKDELEIQHDIPSPVYECDTEVIFPVWKALNFDFIELNKQLKGEYALVILHLKHNIPFKIHASVDPCSVRPLFYSIDQVTHSFLFSSLLSGIAKMDVQATRLDGGNCLSYYFPFGRSNMKSYIDWNPPLPAHMKNDKYSARSEIVACLKRCIKRRLQSDRPIGCFLSGGLDSSLVAALVSRELKKRGKRLHTFSIGAADSEDCKHAEIVARHIDSIHTTVPFDSWTAIGYLQEVVKATETFDLTTIRASIGQFLVSKYIAENTDIKVVFSGDGADEEQMGYLYFYLAPNAQEAQEESRKLLQQIHLYDGLRVDRCVSYHGLEARVPYLDWEFVELYLSFPADWKMPKRGIQPEKHLIRSAFMQCDPHVLPQCVLMRTKETFSDSLSTSQSSWYSLLQSTIAREMSSIALKTIVESMRGMWKHCPPETDEGAYYRYLFTVLFGNKSATTIPHIWMPKWSKTRDPSARTLETYNAK